jgi:hypothetical protein
MTFNRHFLYAALTSAFAILFPANALAQSPDRPELLKELTSLRKELSEKEELFLSPSAEDLAAHAEFLKQPDTGLIRLFPRGLYENRLTIQGSGAYYSFTRRTHEYGRGSDIELQEPRRSADNEYVPPPIAEYTFHTVFAGANFGVFATLGNVPLEKVTLDYKRIKDLVAYSPPSTLPGARAEQRRILDGFRSESFGNLSTVPVQLNFTYAVRSINYRESDVLVAFRVVRKEIDGSVVILWKILKRFPTPTLRQ